MKTIIFLISLMLIPGISVYSKTNPVSSNKSENLDLEKFARQIYDLYQTDEVPAKKERLVSKKLMEIIGKTYTMKVTTSDSIVYNKKDDKTSVKSKEIYYSDNKKGYIGIFVIFEKQTDELLMTTSPDKEMSITGNVTDVIVMGYFKNDMFNKVYTPIKDFDDSGTTIQQIVIKVQM
jgi:hypothetical protein